MALVTRQPVPNLPSKSPWKDDTSEIEGSGHSILRGRSSKVGTFANGLVVIQLAFCKDGYNDTIRGVITGVYYNFYKRRSGQSILQLFGLVSCVLEAKPTPHSLRLFFSHTATLCLLSSLVVLLLNSHLQSCPLYLICNLLSIHVSLCHRLGCHLLDAKKADLWNLRAALS